MNAASPVKLILQRCIRMFWIIQMLTNMSAPNDLAFARKPSGKRFLKSVLHIKKALRHPKADEGKRQSFKRRIERHKKSGKALIYIDESGFAHDMPHTHGYAQKGARCVGTKNWNAKGRTNVIGALMTGVLITTWLCNFNIDSDVFHAWITKDLLPKLPKQAVIVMDNATFHKRSDTQKAIKEAGYFLEYLPPYSPDLNPIEHKWAQAKSVRRKTGKTVEQIFKQDKWNQI